jgi:hypothetical protein
MKNFYLIPFLSIVILFSSISCISNKFKQNNKAQKEYLLNIEIVEKFIIEKGTNNTETLNNSVLFLERITKIKSEKYEGFDLYYFPSEQNLKDWKDWFNKNKKSLYWDEKEQKVVR